MKSALSLEAEDIQFNTSVPDALVVSSAVPKDNVEIRFAKKAGERQNSPSSRHDMSATSVFTHTHTGIPIYNRSQWLARVTKSKASVRFASLIIL